MIGSRSLLYLLACLTVSLHCHAAGGEIKCPQAYRGLVVQVNLPAGHVLSRDQPIAVGITIHNGSSKSIRIPSYMEPPYHWFNFEVIGPAGRSLPYRGAFHKIVDDDTRRLTLDPGYFWGRRIDDLRESYDLTQPGRYRLRAIYGVSPSGQCARGSISSDPVSFEVVTTG